MKVINKIARNKLVGFVPRGIRVRCKRILTKMALYDERAVSIGLEQIFEDDTFIVSYPKSGNTWVRFLIANMLHPEITITFRNIEQYVPDIHKSRVFINSMKRPRFIKTHHSLYNYFPRFIYVYRDGRDAMVSYYFYACQRGWFKGTFSDFLRSKISKTYGFWHEHVSKAIEYAKREPAQTLLLQYERMLEFPIECAQKVAEFCQLAISQKTIESAVQRCAFKNLKKIEEGYGSELEKVDMEFFRSGRSGQWGNMFSDDDLKEFLSMAGDALQQLDYLEFDL